MNREQVPAFRHALLAWYRSHARDLPWRRTTDPYCIWISEIMLQQTRVAAVLDHYARFLERFPAVSDLAIAPEADVLALWSGLGYYRRARMMHRAAQAIVQEYGGQFPQTAAGLLKLPGIGAYTAAAVASIAYGESVAVVDGNVERVLRRVAALDETKPDASAPTPVPPNAGETELSASTRGAGLLKSIAIAVRELADLLVDPEHPSHFNQAMMELGATICLPRGPLCLQCPVQSLCRTRGEHPTVARKPPVARNAFYALAERFRKDAAEVLLERRPAAASLMAGMWQLPELSQAPADAEELCSVKHAITVTNYTVRVYALEWSVDRPWRLHDWETGWFPLDRVYEQPLTGLARKVLRKLRTVPA